MASLLDLADNGGGSGPMVSLMGQMLGGPLPTSVPSETGMGMGTIATAGADGDTPTDVMSTALLNAISAQSGNSEVPFQQELNSDLAPFFSGMAYQDTSYYTTDEGVNDMVWENYVAAAPWDDGADQTIQQYDPLFKYHSDSKQKSPGFEIVATPPIINQIQARLQQSERNAALYGVNNQAALRTRGPAPLRMGNNNNNKQQQNDRFDKRMRLYDVGHARARVPAATGPTMVSAEQLESLRAYGSLTPEGLYEKLEYLGPVTQIYESTGPTNAIMAPIGRINERLINYSYYSRGKIQNMFGERLMPGDSLYFTIAKYSRDQLLALGAPRSMLGRKRGYETLTNGMTTVGLASRGTSGDEFTQLRGWSSRDGQEYLPNTEPLENMRPAAQDRFYVDRMRRAASEYVELDYDPQTGELSTRDILASEGLQEAVASLPDLVIENYLAPGIIIPVGVVKQRLNRPTTRQAILNAHYDQNALALLPHVEIIQNRI
jgi:hypothetical protein